MPESKSARDKRKTPKNGAATGQPTRKPDKPGVLPDEPMGDAGRKVLAFYFQTLLAHESIIRQQLAPESQQASADLIGPIHDMRVTTRRLRSALRLFASFLPGKRAKRFRKTLAEIGIALGAVRDLHVLRLKAAQYMETLPEANRHELTALLDDWQNRLDMAKQALIATFNSSAYERFTLDFAQFVAETSTRLPDTSPRPSLVRHLVPSLIYQQFAIVRAYENALENAPLDLLHDLRIQAKRLRYLLEAFEEILGREARTVIEAIKGLQDHLGHIQDARIANQIMREYTMYTDERQPTSAVLQYMAVREAEIQSLLAEVQQAWRTFTRLEVRQSLALSVSQL